MKNPHGNPFTATSGRMQDNACISSAERSKKNATNQQTENSITPNHEQYEERIRPAAPECASGRLHRTFRATHHPERGGHCVVSHAGHQLHPAGVHGVATRGMAQIPATLRLWCFAGHPLDSFLWLHQGVQCFHRRNLLLAHRFLYGSLRAAAAEETVFVARTALFAHHRCRCALHLLARRALSLRHQHRCGLVGSMCRLCHLQQESQRGGAQPHGADVPNDGRTGRRVGHHPPSICCSSPANSPWWWSPKAATCGSCSAMPCSAPLACTCCKSSP